MEYARCILRKELSGCIRLTEFQYTWKYDGKYHGDQSFNLVTKDYEFEIVWTITYSAKTKYGTEYFCKWKRIKFDKCNKNIFGNIEIKATSEHYNGMTKILFEPNSFPFEQDINLMCSSGSITITMQVYQEDERSSRPFLETYDNFLESKKSSDVVFTVDNEEISANKCILSLHSEVFARMFESDMVEKKTGQVKITDIEPEIFKLMLRFIYSRQLDCQDTEELLKLITVADKYEVRSLVSLCGYRISNKLTVDNAIEALVIADCVRDNHFKEECITFIINNRKKVTETENFKNILVATRADLLAEIFCRM